MVFPLGGISSGGVVSGRYFLWVVFPLVVLSLGGVSSGWSFLWWCCLRAVFSLCGVSSGGVVSGRCFLYVVFPLGGISSGGVVSGWCFLRSVYWTFNLLYLLVRFFPFAYLHDLLGKGINVNFNATECTANMK